MRNTRRANQVRTMQAVLPAARPLDRERNDRNGQPGHLRSAHNRQRRRWICCPPRLSTFTSHPDTGACSMKRRSARKRPVTTRQHGVPVSANLTSPRDMVRFIVLIPHAQAEGSSPHRARDDRPRCGDLPRFGAITGAVRASTHATESEWRPSRSATGNPARQRGTQVILRRHRHPQEGGLPMSASTSQEVPRWPTAMDASSTPGRRPQPVNERSAYRAHCVVDRLITVLRRGHLGRSQPITSCPYQGAATSSALPTSAAPTIVATRAGVTAKKP